MSRRYAYTDLIADILKRPVHERSQNFITKCLWHDDRLPSLSIDLDRGLYMCFGCGARGGIHSLADQEGHVLDEVQVALRAYESTSGDMYEDHRDFSDLAKELRRNLYTMHPTEAVEYIVNRKLSPSVIEHFGVGWKPYGGNLAFPYYDDESVAGVKYRDRNGNKTMESGSRRILYNVNDLRGRPEIILCEGESDTHAVWSIVPKRDSLGIGGISGASMTKTTMELWALDIMWSDRIYLAYDADDAGDKAAEIGMTVLGEKAVRLRPTKGKDISDHLMNGGTMQEIGFE